MKSFVQKLAIKFKVFFLCSTSKSSLTLLLTLMLGKSSSSKSGSFDLFFFIERGNVVSMNKSACHMHLFCVSWNEKKSGRNKNSIKMREMSTKFIEKN